MAEQLLRWCVVAVLLAAQGCYLSHDQEPAPRCGEEVSLCDAPADVVRLPLGVCRGADGMLEAFATGEGPVACEAVGDGFRFSVGRCPGAAETRVVASCGPSGPAPRFEGGPIHGSRTFDLSESDCAVVPHGHTEPAEPWQPFDETEGWCVDVATTCGRPFVIELRGGTDPCNGQHFAHRCTAEVVGQRLILRAEGARSSSLMCETSIAERIVPCALPPVPAGEYTIEDNLGRRFGTLMLGPVPEGEPSAPSWTSTTRLPVVCQPIE
jgi:hypothetical protein